MIRKNDWRSCTFNPPEPYKRVEIRDKNNKVYIGYYTEKKVYLTSFKHKEIKFPLKWRDLLRPNVTADGVNISDLIPKKYVGWWNI